MNLVFLHHAEANKAAFYLNMKHANGVLRKHLYIYLFFIRGRIGRKSVLV